ncbi:SsrA-binding protein SmpB [Candidatus Uhrbacteria bacterium]|nr:SsrA-binding protein SmpB [Candidatus Uhrbacteria bacterium]
MSAAPSSVLALNKRATYDYEILETFEAGIALLGHEVKSARAGHCHLRGSFVHIRNGEAWLTNAYIAPYAKSTNLRDPDPTRSRRLLLHHRELHRLIGQHHAEHLTIVPLRIYLRRNHIKVAIALVRGKRKFEKRAAIKKREDARHMRRAILR